MLIEQETPDTQEEQEIIEESTEEETVEVELEVDEEDESEEDESEEDTDFGDAFGDDEDGSDAQNEPLGDLKALVKDNPEALKRATEVEAGLIKLQSQKEEAESFVSGINEVFKGLEAGDMSAVKNFETILIENTGLTFQALAELTDGETPAVENAKLQALEKKLNALESERASTKWITEVGEKVSAQVERETGLKFTPQLLWSAKPHLSKGAKAEDVRKAVMRIDPDAYDKAVSVRDGAKQPVPRSAVLPKGKSGAKVTFEHTGSGFLKAYNAEKARGGT